MKTLFISTPVHDGQLSILHVDCMLRLLSTGWYNFIRSTTKGAGIARARNNSVAEFLGTPADYFFSLDGDIVFQPEQVKRLVEHDRDIACGLYCHKRPGPVVWSANSLPEKEADGQLQSVANTGFGFVLIKRHVIEHMIEAHPELAYVEDLEAEKGQTKYNLFPMGVMQPDGVEILEPRYVTEDFWFFYLARKLGYKVWADTGCVVGHEGSCVYPLQADMEAS